MTQHSESTGEHPSRRGLGGHETSLPIEPAPADRCGADERAIRAETPASQFATLRKIKLRALIDLFIRRGKERVAKTKRYRSRHDRKTEVQKVRHRRNRPTDQTPGSFNNF